MQVQNRWGVDHLDHISYPDQFNKIKRWREFDTNNFIRNAKSLLNLARKTGKITITDQACPCTRNHFAISVGEKLMCPVRFWLGCAALIETERQAKEFVEKHPIAQLLKPIKKDIDPTYDPERSDT